MAEPVDYFMQGTSLGMRAAQSAEQTRQFQTNLSERARQFELNQQIQKGNLDLRNKEFGLAQDRAVLENELAGYQIDEAKILAGELRRKTDEAKEYLPVVQQFQTKLNSWNGVGEPPVGPTDVPYEVGLKIESLRSTAIKNAQNNKTLQLNEKAREFKQGLWNDGLSWMMQNSFKDVEFDNEGNPFYDFNTYMQKRSAANQFDRNLKLMTTRAALNKSKPRTQAELAAEWARENVTKYYNPPTDQNPKGSFDSVGFQNAYLAQLDPSNAVKNVPPALDESSGLDDMTSGDYSMEQLGF